jgi:activator of 2-hydroxyglutaryl-CoA dehydratase
VRSVFAESELISLNARGERRENIAAGIHLATARRVKNLVNRLGLEPDLVFSGGVSNNIGMWKALEELLGHPISVVKLDTVYAGALGAAILAQKSLAGEDFAEKLRPGKPSSTAVGINVN